MTEGHTPSWGNYYFNYGHAMASWAALEAALCQLFLRMTGMKIGVGKSVFYSANSFRARLDMIGACFDHVRVVPAGREFLGGVVGLASAYTRTRNRLAHDQHLIEFPEDITKGIMLRIAPPISGEMMTEPDMLSAATNFHHLTLTIHASFGDQKLLREPELCLALLDLLPREPTHTPLDTQTLSDRLQEIAHH